MRQKDNKRKASYEKIIDQRAERLGKSQETMIGIDIGSSFIKAVQMKNGKVIKMGMEVLPDGMVNQGRIIAQAQLAEVIKKLLKTNRIKGKSCSVCISGNELIVRELKLPEMNEKQIMENIQHEITSFLPMNQDDYCIDYKILEYLPPQEGSLSKLRIMVVAAPSNLLQTYIDTLKLANLKTEFIDVGPNIVSKLAKQIMMKGGLKGNTKNIGIIDFGAYSTNMIILKDGNYFLHKAITNGGDYLTSQIAKKIEIDSMEAEEYKKKINFIENNYHNNEYLYIKNYIDFLIMDIERTIEFYKSRNNQIGLDMIYITGGGSLLKGLPEYLKEHFGIEVASWSNALQHYRKSNENADRLVFFSQAIGATLREE